jgi:hypothetical protein
MLDSKKVSPIINLLIYFQGHYHLSFTVSLSLNHQLIRSIDGIPCSSSLGIILPSTLTPLSMSIIDSNDKAVLLISDCIETIVIFQLQRLLSGDEITVHSRLALHGGVNPGIENVFLASASFHFDLEHAGMILRPISSIIFGLAFKKVKLTALIPQLITLRLVKKLVL